MSKHTIRNDSPYALSLLAALKSAGPIELPDLAAILGSPVSTVKRYARDLIATGHIHITARRRDDDGLEVPTYTVGPGECCARLQPLNGVSKAKLIAERSRVTGRYPMPYLPPPCPITAALMGMSVGI